MLMKMVKSVFHGTGSESLTWMGDICFRFALFLSGVSKMEIATYNYYKYVILETGNN